MSKDNEQGTQKKGGLFSDISAAQVIATALAAVTSMLLASAIGIYGSIIGVAVASIISTLAASLYKKFLADSAEKLKELPAVVKTATLHAPSTDEEAPGDKESEDGGEERPEAAKAAEDEQATSPSDAPKAPPLSVHQKRVVIGLIVVCVVSALVAVAATAGVVYLITTGEGLGAKPEPIIKVERVHDTQVVHDADSSSASSDSSSEETSSSQASSSATDAQNSQPANTTNDTPENTSSSASGTAQPDDAAHASSAANTSHQQTNQENTQKPSATTNADAGSSGQDQ